MITHFTIRQQYCHTLNETNNSLGPQQFLVATKQWQSTVIDGIFSWVRHMCGIKQRFKSFCYTCMYWELQLTELHLKVRNVPSL